MDKNEVLTEIEILKKENKVLKEMLSKINKTLEEKRDYLLKLDKKNNPLAKSKAYGINWCINTIMEITKGVEINNE